MDLQTFVSDALVQVIAGVADAQVKTNDTGAFINPRHAVTRNKDGTIYSTHMMPDQRQAIEFDVALTVTESSEKSGRGGVRVAVIDAGGEVRASSSEQRVSRIKFSVTVVLPSVG